MKRFKRPISEVVKTMFHQDSSKPIIPNLGVNSKTAESSSPNKLVTGMGGRSGGHSGGGSRGGGKTAAEQAAEALKTQQGKNAANKKAGKAVNYKDAYADADKKKYKTQAEFEKAARAYNTKKYNSTNPTADAKKAGKTKAELAKSVTEKNKVVTPPATTTTTTTPPATTTTKKVEPTKVEVAKNELKKTKKENKVEKLEGRAAVATAKGKDKKASRLTDKAERKATGKTRKEQGRNFFGGKTKDRKRKEAAEAAVKKANAAKSPATYKPKK